ncbi:hypothetical protein GUITHDRAFT_139370 [Guillardia theta CCMP2712]|uniref:Phosphotyrosine protein phosphatase I domain-containing protein n=1 Tax=Guillardia theta (strain CCMP2712) TaxID=905079 RepID=L1J9U0_GUITC|nr:hypothetical protein GUITHDRAFT_139370 [Guillardia theta CCMP2712]EKX45107.1 hypothetical protein GUITHDRAFT_139370 [Guillardia theta CCMP2712]|eukprot:XP_005832087.1 hypothetical protein GUITHDRAFT_139370 [Guillardia theta CCMP2712]
MIRAAASCFLCIIILTILFFEGCCAFASVKGNESREPYKILAVCTGNTCRSPMMMVLLRREIKKMNLSSVHVESAGIGEKAGWKRHASPNALALFPSELSEHRSAHVSSKLVTSFQRVLCMENKHASYVREQCLRETNNGTRDDIQHLSLDSQGKQDVKSDPCMRRVRVFPGELEDPFGKSLEEYQNCSHKLQQWAREIMREVSQEMEVEQNTG